jgi:hypothetical protein
VAFFRLADLKDNGVVREVLLPGLLRRFFSANKCRNLFFSEGMSQIGPCRLACSDRIARRVPSICCSNVIPGIKVMGMDFSIHLN